jgi:hypothetical protein
MMEGISMTVIVETQPEPEVETPVVHEAEEANLQSASNE